MSEKPSKRQTKKELDVTDRLLEDRDGFILALAGILGECPAHGPACMPHLLQTVRDLAGKEGRISCALDENHDADPRDRETCREIPDAERLKNRPNAYPPCDREGKPFPGYRCWNTTIDSTEWCESRHVIVGMFTGDKFWRPLVDGDVIREEDRLRHNEDDAQVFEVEREDGRWIRFVDGTEILADSLQRQMGWEILR